MAAKRLVEDIKRDLEGMIGERIRLRANKGRRKVVEWEGVLEKTYPHIFIIRLEERSYSQRVSYSYTDILTETVELLPCPVEQVGAR